LVTSTVIGTLAASADEAAATNDRKTTDAVHGRERFMAMSGYG
jgi:hypothetical protein